MRKDSKYITKKTHQNTREERKRSKEQRGTTKTAPPKNYKMAISTQQLIITLNTDGLHLP